MDKTQLTKDLVTKIMSFFGTSPQLDVKSGQDGLIEVDIKGDNLNYLIGYRGQSLDALADLLGHMLYKQTNEWPSLMVDINGYNQQRIDRLHNLAKRFIDRVRFFQTEVEMPMLNPWERRQIHTYITDYDDVESESRGEGRNRKMYLMPKKRKQE
jgi:spoIIIJ-associated protein